LAINRPRRTPVRQDGEQTGNGTGVESGGQNRQGDQMKIFDSNGTEENYK